MVQLRIQPGGAGASDSAVFLLAAGDAVRRAAADLLRLLGQLDRLPHQCPLRRVPLPQGEGGRQLQEPRHPVVRSARWAAGPVLEGGRSRLQLHVPALRLRHPADRLREQHLLHQRPAGQADMDVHLRRVLRHHGVHPVLPQLPDLVLPGARHDHLHRVVPRHRRAPQRPGRRRLPHRPDQAGSLLHRRHQHPLHLRRPRRHSRDHARDVEARQVQVHLPAGDAVRVHADAAVGIGHVLGVRRRAAEPLECLLAAAQDQVARRGGDPDADPPVHHVRVRVHAALLRVGEGDRDARRQEHLQARAGAAPHRGAHLVPRHHLPLLRAHQLRRRRAARQLHRLHHPLARAHPHLPLGLRAHECSGEATLLPTELDGDVRDQRLHRGVGAGGRVRARRLGQHGQLHQADRHVRALRQVLPVPQAARPCRGAVAGAVAAPLVPPVRRPRVRGSAGRRQGQGALSRVARRLQPVLIARFWSPCNIQASSSPLLWCHTHTVVELSRVCMGPCPALRSGPRAVPLPRCFPNPPDRSIAICVLVFVWLATHIYE